MQSPAVSIITPAYNSAKFIAETIQSVQNQTFRDWEMIIADDCSTDETAAITMHFAENDDRIKPIRLEHNSGTGIARNAALKIASGKYIAFLDADDLWKPEKLEKQLDFMQSRSLPFTFCFYDCIDEEGNFLGKTVEAPMNLSYKQLFLCNYVGNLTGIYDAEIFGKIEINAARKRQDWMLWLTILKKMKQSQPVPESMAVYRVRKNSVSASKWELIRHNFAVYRNFHRLNLVAAAFNMLRFLYTQLLVKPHYTKKVKA